MTILLLAFCAFMGTLILTTLLLEAVFMLPGWKERRDSERRNHVH